MEFVTNTVCEALINAQTYRLDIAIAVLAIVALMLYMGMFVLYLEYHKLDTFVKYKRLSQEFRDYEDMRKRII